MPKKETKTGIDYEWFIHKRYKWFINALLGLKKENLKKEDMTPKLRWFHTAIIQKDLMMIKECAADGFSLCFRSIRRYHANHWYLYYERCLQLGVEPIPNPLQHNGTKTMQLHYIDVMKNTTMKERQKLIAIGKSTEKPMGTAFEYDPSCDLQD